MSFAAAWYASTYNIFWFMKYLVPIVAAALSTIFKSRSLTRILFFASIFITYFVAVNAITTKWELRRRAATTQKQYESVAARDGANLAAAGFIIGPFEAVLYNSIAFGISAAIRPRNLKPAQKVIQIHPLDPE
jgi:hypothetical protein